MDTNNNTTKMSKIDTVNELLEHIQKKQNLLLEWKENHDAALELAEGGCLDKSDKFDDRCIEIEEYFEDIYGITFDSYGDMYEN